MHEPLRYVLVLAWWILIFGSVLEYADLADQLRDRNLYRHPHDGSGIWPAAFGVYPHSGDIIPGTLRHGLGKL